jgi:hypothetical protein
MRKITSINFAFGAFVIATAPVKADSQKANMILMQIGSVERQAPTAQMSNDAYGGYAQSGETARRICTYIGGPKTGTWACR